MSLFTVKTKSEIQTEMENYVLNNTSITNMTAGSIAKTLLEIFNEKLNECYEYLDTYTAMSFLSTAQDNYLTMIGEMLACERQPNEIDDNYRYRISKQVFTAAAANTTAIRLKCLSISDVDDVVITPYSRGNGSFTIHVITDEIDTPDSVLAEVEAIVSETKAEGIRVIVARPTVIPINVTFNIVKKPASSASSTTIANQIKESLNDYIEGLSMGGTISTSKIVEIADSNTNVTTVYVSSLTIDGNEMILDSGYQLDWDERAYMNTVTVII
jgi:uncharacterized phage protein gp47/JayE